MTALLHKNRLFLTIIYSLLLAMQCAVQVEAQTKAKPKSNPLQAPSSTQSVEQNTKVIGPSSATTELVPDPSLKITTPEKAAVDPVVNKNINTDPKEIDRVIAVVNREVITYKELLVRVRLVEQQLQEAKRAVPPRDVLEKQAFERLIDESIMFQEAQNMNLRIPDPELDFIINNVAAQQNLSVEQFLANVKKDGFTEKKFRENFRRDVVISRYRERAVESKVKISDAEITDYINMRVGQANSAEDQELLYLAQILVPLQDGVSSSDLSQAREKAEAILAKVTNEVDFLQYANALVKTDKLVRVQDLGYRSIDRLPKLFIDASVNVKAGQLIPQVVRSPAGFHILKMLDRKAPNQNKTIQIVQNEIRQILITQKPGVLDEDTQRRLRNYRDQVLSKTVDFGDLAKKFSEDKNTASQQGYIGWVSPGQSLAEFDVALANLRAGSVSDPIRTEFGWHLLQVINTRQTEVTLAQQKEFARAAIRQEKLDRAYQDWVRELRDSATIDLRPPYTLQK